MRTRVLAVSATLAATLSLAPVDGAATRRHRRRLRARRTVHDATTSTPLVFGTAVRPTWLPDERFWYRERHAERRRDLDSRRSGAGTRTSSSLSAARRRRRHALEHHCGASRHAGSLSADGKSVIVAIAGRSVTCDVASATCNRRDGRGGRGAGAADVVGAAADAAAAARAGDDVARRQAAARSFATGICGCATSPPVARRSSRPTA